MNLHPREFTPEERERGKKAVQEVDKRLQRYFAIKALSESAERVLASDTPIESFRDVLEGAQSIAERTGFSFIEAVARASRNTYTHLSITNDEVTQESVTDFFIDRDTTGDTFSDEDRESVRNQVAQLSAQNAGADNRE